MSHTIVVLPLILALLVGPTASNVQESTVPNVRNTEIPVYPRLAQYARIEGVVKLRVTTDGKKTTKIEIVSGQPMLAQAAKENISTWLFEAHEPTTFETTFRYRLIRTKCDAKCNCEGDEKEQVIQHLPAEVEVVAKEVRICEPVFDGVFTKLQIKLNGTIIDLPSKVTFRIRERVFDVPVREGGLQVPSELKDAKDVGISFATDRIQISTIVAYGAKLWRPTLIFILEDQRFEDSSAKGSKARAACIIDFGDGTQMFDPTCRSEKR